MFILSDDSDRLCSLSESLSVNVPYFELHESCRAENGFRRFYLGVRLDFVRFEINSLLHDTG